MQSALDPIENVTVPVGTNPVVEVTVADKVTDSPSHEGLGLEVPMREVTPTTTVKVVLEGQLLASPLYVAVIV